MLRTKDIPFIPKKKRAVSRPTLISAVFDADATAVTLTFDRAVAVSGDNVEQLTLNDVGTHRRYATGAGYTQDSDNVITAYLDDVGAFAGSSSTLSAGAASGVYATDTGAVWAGVTAFPV